MMPCSLRSLLLAVIVLSNCITWTVSRHHFTHNASGHRSRHRRQGAGLYLSGSYVVPEGEGSGWGEWGEVSPCSRTCGGGVASQKRICLQIGSDGQPQCTGGDTKYFSCETQDCPAGAQDFRSIQCAHYNNESFRGIKYKWEPYMRPSNPCELNCMPHGERFYYRHKAKVVDGTRCNDDSFDVCVNGTCQPVGCDMMLGSNAREDKCRQCRGNGANCYTANGLLDTQALIKGYNEMLLIPEGATSIYVAEVRPSNNYLALQAKNGTYYLNGDYHIDFPRSMVIAGALWHYERNQQGFAAPDKLRCMGPTTEPLYLSLLLQDENVGIEYEYSLPSKLAPRPTKKYNWVHEDFTPCSVSCAGGFRTRNVTCRSSEELEIASDGLCDERLKPPTNETCNTQPCPVQWIEGPWSQCSKRCGKGGTRSREIRCEKIIVSGFSSIVSDKECFDALGPKPELYQECNINASCPTWFTGRWRPCDKLCGEGKQTRQVVCYQKNAGRIEVLGDEECAEEKPQAEQPCTLQLCDGVDWVVTGWSGCDTCLSTVRTRVALCATKDRKVVNSSFCEYHPTPVLEEPCDVVPPCQVQWYATQWSKCSVECGKGVQTRQVFCGRFENEAVVIVNDSLCASLPKYNDTKPCEVPKEKCPSKWYASPWSACTKECGGGEQYRRVMCLRGNQPANDCAVELVLDSSQICNDGPCNKDEILPLNPNSTPIMDDEEEDCIDEEDYPEVGLDKIPLDPIPDEKLSSVDDILEGSGMEYPVSADFVTKLLFDDTGSGFELTSTDDELSGTKQTDNTTDTTEATELSTNSNTTDMDYDYTDNSTTDISDGTSETGSTDSSEFTEISSIGSSSSTNTDETTETESDATESTITEVTVLEKKKIMSTLSSKPLITLDRDITKKTTVSRPADESTVTYEETFETETTESSETDDISEFTTETGITDTDVTKELFTTSDNDITKESTVSLPTDETRRGDITDEISETESTESSETSEISPTESSSSTNTDETTETESDVTESTLTEVTDLEKKKIMSTLSSKSLTTLDKDITKKTTVSPPTDESTETNISEKTSETEATESSETDETSELTTDTGITESTLTEVTDLEKKEIMSTLSSKSLTTFDKDITKKTTVSPPTDETTETNISDNTSETETTASSETDETSELTTDTGITGTMVTKELLTTPDKDATKESTVSPPTDESRRGDITDETLETESTESAETDETSLTSSTSSHETDNTSDITTETGSSVTEPTKTEVTDLKKDETTLSTVTESSKETSETETTESSEIVETSTTEFPSSIKVTKSSITTELSESTLITDTKSSESASSESSTIYKTNATESTELTATTATFESETTTTQVSTKEESSPTASSKPEASESTLSEETSETSSTLPSITTLVSETMSSSTEPLLDKTTEAKTETTELSSTTEIPTTAATLEITSSSESSSMSVTIEETTEAKVESTELSSSTEASTVAATILETSSRSAATEETTESVSTASLSVEPKFGTTETLTEETTESASTVSLLAETKPSSTELLTEETTEGEIESTELGSTTEASTVAATTFETSSKLAITEETTESVSTVSLSVEPKLETTETLTEETTEAKLISTELSSATEISTTSPLEETTEPSTTELSTEFTESTTPFTEETSTSASSVSSEGTSATAISTSKIETETTEGTTSSTQSVETSETTAGTLGKGSSEKTTEISTTEGTTVSAGSTIRDWTTTFRQAPTRPICKKKRKLRCSKTKFGCCPDRKTAAAGPFDEGCPKPKTCKEAHFGCCPDEISPALGPKYEGCPIMPCAETLFGCCLSDNRTAAEGNDQEGCPPTPPACKSSKYGCCEDGTTEATGPENLGCPEYSTTQTSIETESTSQKETMSTETSSTVVEGCAGSAFGCCFDNKTEASGPEEQGCPCNITEFGCCPDGVSPAHGTQMEGCMASCNTSMFGCCPDGKTPAHGSDLKGCCLLYPFGCCPDNHKPAEGPHLEGCGCQHARFGCCPDNVTYARGPGNEGCGCQYSTHGCCPDRHTEASGPSYEGCGCHTYQFGCCPDGITIAKGPGLQGCQCYQSKYGCCGDGETAASGPDMQGCDCSSSKYGCCPDGVTEAKGTKFSGCTDIPLNRQAACSLSTDRGSCRNYSVNWYYDLEYGGCSRFWYGGCEGNGNRFTTKEECEDVCVQPSPQDTCKLPKVKGACTGYNVRWYYDNEREQCSQFVFGGCLGNANNFDSRELCQAQCEPTRTADQCSLPIDRGSCSGNFGRWGFNAETRRCEQFIWGGCEGNSNRFGSEAACVLRCDPPGVPKAQCTQLQDVGNCTDKEAAWSFSQSENRCVPFYYTGCGGNDNRFNTEQNCIAACPSSYIPDVCTLPAETGDCANYRERWFFDTSEQRCRQFYYGGCGGNSNNFASQMECENRCNDFAGTTTVHPSEPRTHGAENISANCLLEKDPGPCTQMSTRWAYDYTIGKCTNFQYGGCGGNVNNFPSEETCKYYCKPVQDICQLPMLSGPCDDSIMRWFYDATTDACNQFTYGGCQGNDNRFETRDDCERRCRTGPPVEAQTTTTITSTTTTTTSTPSTTIAINIDNRINEVIPEACTISSELEKCTAAGTVWYFDSEHRDCVAHDNKDSGNVCRHTGTFSSEEACQRSCGAFRNINVCRYSLDPGPCQNFVPKYYFNQTSSNCHEFAYGGCHGGPNRFSSYDECLQTCRPEMDPCKQSPEPGNCLERFEFWYYDYYRDSCSRFTYTGCGGNDNRFDTREDCEGRCRQRPAAVTTTSTTVEVARTTTTTTTAAPTYTVEPIAEECRTPESLTPCGVNITTFYYDSERRACVQSNIGACRHTNSYRSEEECERKCGAFKNITITELCEARLNTGPCRASIPKFYWDFASGRCQPYAYGGCGGGPNRFSTNEECEEVCGSTGPGSNDVLPACSLYENECSRLECAYGIDQRRDSEGCVRCSCKVPEVDCEPLRLECETLRCPYGIQRLTDENRCQRCICFEDPCLAHNCTVGQQCVAVAYRDPVTEEPRYSAQCRPIIPEPPNCDRFNDECSRLECGELGVQRVRTMEGCERCSCVPLQIDCEPLRHECLKLRCTYGMERNTGSDGCERCKCTGPPCENKECAEGDRCVTVPYRDPITQDTRYAAECRTVNKTGYCPVRAEQGPATTCARGCNDDADCRGVAKCCHRGCSLLCLEPDPATVPTASPTYTTTHKPDIPEPPQVNHETEPEVSGTEGGRAVLRCLFHGNPPPKITWTRGEITIDADEGRYRLLSDGALEIVSLYRNDSGVYICIADNGLGTARQEVHLQVKDPVKSPMSIAGEPNAVLTGELGRPLVIRCLVYGYPPPTVYWLRGLNGPMVPFSSSLYEARLPGVLLIRRLTIDTVGEYLCQAYNGVGRPATKLFVVQAYQTDESPYISKYIVPRERQESETVRVRVIDAATASITTHTEGTTTIASTTTILTTPEPDIEFEKPIFHVAVRTHISAPQTTLTAGSELSLPCEVDGYPDPEVYWTKDNVRLVARDNLWISGTSISRLTIPHLAVSDSGVYGCHAGNAYSSHYSTVQINVQGLTIPAKCTDNPFFANCHLIVRSKFCQHKYYSVFCCKSCMEAGQLSPEDVDVQSDQAWAKARK